MESAKADVKVKAGKWYYEVTLSTFGPISIGFCNDKSNLKVYSALGQDSDSFGWNVQNR